MNGELPPFKTGDTALKVRLASTVAQPFKMRIEKETTEVVVFVSLMFCYTEKTRTSS